MKAFASIALAALSLSLATAHAEEPAVTPFKVGALELATLRDMKFVMPNDNKVFGVGLTPEAVASVLKAAGAPTDTVTLSVDVLLIKDGKHVILIDTGIGPKMNGALVGSLKQAGLTPEDVTDVLITHGHGDHIGGLLNAEGQSTFAKATIRLTTPEWEAMKGRADVADLVKVITPQVQAFAPGAQVLPSIKAVVIAGHTPGHTGYEITSGKAKLLAIGDAAHSSIVSLSHPEWTIQFDGDSKTATATREALLAKLAKSGETIYSPHFPYPGVGTIKAAAKGYVWNPTVKP